MVFSLLTLMRSRKPELRAGQVDKLVILSYNIYISRNTYHSLKGDDMKILLLLSLLITTILSYAEFSKASPATSVPSEQFLYAEADMKLYGEHTLNWWSKRLQEKRNEIRKLETEYIKKKNAIGFVEEALREKRFFNKSIVETYERYKKEAPEDELKLRKLEKELEEFIRQARLVAVPRKIREGKD